jgi:hypothetical protein
MQNKAVVLLRFRAASLCSIGVAHLDVIKLPNIAKDHILTPSFVKSIIDWSRNDFREMNRWMNQCGKQPLFCGSSDLPDLSFRRGTNPIFCDSPDGLY